MKKRFIGLGLVLVLIVIFFTRYDLILGNGVSFKEKPRAFDLSGLRVYSIQDPSVSLPSVLDGQFQVLRLNLRSDASSDNSVFGAASAEIVRALKAQGKNVSVYGVVSNPSNATINAACNNPLNFTNKGCMLSDSKLLFSCDASNSFCGDYTISISSGDCNCLKVSDKIEVVGDNNFLLTKRIDVGKLFGFVLSPQFKAR